MKKLISLLMVLVLCIACVSAPAYATDLDTPEESADINRNSNVWCSGSDSSSYFYGKATITIYVDGYVTLNNNGSPIGFSCSNAYYNSSSSSGSVSGSVSYTGYYISGNSVYVTVYYNFSFMDGSINSPESGSTTICIY